MHPFRLIEQLAIVSLLISAPIAAVQSQTPAAKASSSAPETNSPLAKGIVMQARADLVLVDLVVTEGGDALHGLDKSHFHVLEDGREQTITSFDEHKPASVPGAARQIKLPPNTYTNLPAYPQVPAVNVLLLDGLNTPMGDQIHVRRQMLQYMAQIPSGTSMAIFTLSSRLRMVAGFTSNSAQLINPLERADANPKPSVVADPQMDSVLDAAVGNTATLNANLEVVAQLQQFEADVAAYETDRRVKMTMDAMQQLARYLSAVPGRKVEVVLSVKLCA